MKRNGYSLAQLVLAIGVLTIGSAAPVLAAESRVTHGGLQKKIAELSAKVADQQKIIARLEQQIRQLTQRAEIAKRELQNAQNDKARLDEQVKALKDAQSPGPKIVPPPAKREVSLAALLKMNSAQLKSCAGCRFTGQLPVVSAEPSPGRLGRFVITLETPAPATQPVGPTARQPPQVRCIVEITVPSGLTVSPHPSAPMSVSGEIKRVETVPPGAEFPQIVYLVLAPALQ